MLLRTTLALVLAGALAGCEPKCDGTLTDILVNSTAVAVTPCTSVSRTGDGKADLIQAQFQSGTVTGVQVEAPRGGSFEVGEYDCNSHDVWVHLHDTGGEEPNNWMMRDFEAGRPTGQVLDGTSCTLSVTSALSSGRLIGTFKGRLGRVQIHPEKYDYADLSFRFSYAVPK